MDTTKITAQHQAEQRSQTAQNKSTSDVCRQQHNQTQQKFDKPAAGQKGTFRK